MNKKKPIKSSQFQNSNICEYCAWTPGNASPAGGKYYCYRFDMTFQWEYDRHHDKGVRLKMNPCSVFRAVPTDMKNGAEFAKYFQNKTQIKASSRRSWLSIGIALLALIVSMIAVYLGYKNN